MYGRTFLCWKLHLSLDNCNWYLQRCTAHLTFDGPMFEATSEVLRNKWVHQTSPKFSCIASSTGSSLIKYSSTESSCFITIWAWTVIFTGQKLQRQLFTCNFFALPVPMPLPPMEAASAFFIFQSFEPLSCCPLKDFSDFLYERCYENNWIPAAMTSFILLQNGLGSICWLK